VDKLARPRPWQAEHGNSTATHTAIARQLLSDVEARLLGPLELLVGPTGLRLQLQADTEMWAAQVTGPDEELAATTARRIISAIYQNGNEFTPPASWWQTPFGALVAQRLGHPTATVVSLSVASAMLGITRQGAHDLVKRGKLARDPASTGITVSSVQDRLAGL
jgi:hypothetical protein